MLRQSFVRKVNCVIKSRMICLIFLPSPLPSNVGQADKFDMSSTQPSQDINIDTGGGEVRGKVNLLGSFSCLKAN